MTYRLERGFALWFTGLPGAGKTTVSAALHRHLDALDIPAVLLDGDQVRPIICEGLGHSPEDRRKSLEQYIRLSSLLTQNRVIVIVAVINHSAEQRRLAAEAHPAGQFGQVWIDTPLDVCRARDPKGLYARGRSDPESGDVVGVNIEYEPAIDSDVTVRTPDETPEQAATRIFDFLSAKVLTGAP